MLSKKNDCPYVERQTKIGGNKKSDENNVNNATYKSIQKKMEGIR